MDCNVSLRIWTQEIKKTEQLKKVCLSVDEIAYPSSQVKAYHASDNLLIVLAAYLSIMGKYYK